MWVSVKMDFQVVAQPGPAAVCWTTTEGELSQLGQRCVTELNPEAQSEINCGFLISCRV